jgi:hypothetical protein
VIVVGELHCVEEVCPIILLICTEHLEICLQPFIVVFHLPLCLRMIGSGEVWVNTKGPVQVLHVRGSKLGTSVGVVGQGKAMQGPHMSDVELG